MFNKEENMVLSEATKRAMQYPKGNGDWAGGFSYTEVKGLGFEKGVHRRDPSSIIKVDDTYYVWYTHSIGPHFGHSSRDVFSKRFPWDYADIFYATSKDGLTWKEEGVAIKRGEKGCYDERTVCTPDVMQYEGKYYLVYQALPQVGTYVGNDEHVALSVAENPNGPWTKASSDILKPMENGFWMGKDNDNYNDLYCKGVTHDPSLFSYNGKFYLYYKCCGDMEKQTFCEVDTRWGVAIADNIMGPYEHSLYNPITNSGHETLLWPYKDGIAALLNRDGPEKDTIQYAKDGINFKLMAKVQDTPQAGGAYRSSNPDLCPLEGVRWGLCHYDERGPEVWNYIVRFDVDTRHPYRRPMQYPMSNCQGLQ
jgi:hypothetical protein